MGVPRRAEFLGDALAQRGFEHAVEGAKALGLQVVEIDYDAFREAAELLYGGPFVAERRTPLAEFTAEVGSGLGGDGGWRAA